MTAERLALVLAYSLPWRTAERLGGVIVYADNAKTRAVIVEGEPRSVRLSG